MQLTNEQYQQIYSVYDQIRMENRQEEKKRLLEVLEKVPDYADLRSRQMRQAFDRAARALSGEEDRLSGSTPQQPVEASYLADLLMSHGYPKDYLDPIYTCPDCQDTGYTGDQKCHCFQKRIIEYLYQQSNLADILDRENFQTFQKDFYPDDYKDPALNLTPRENADYIYQKALDFCDHFDSHADNFIFYGPTGLGKSFLTHCIAKSVLDQTKTVIYLTSTHLFDILEKYKFDSSTSNEEKEEGLSFLNQCDLLIIDDLGTELKNNFTTSELYVLIDARLRGKKSTIISTNLNIEELKEQYSERIFSRIASYYTLIKFIGDDIRLLKSTLD